MKTSTFPLQARSLLTKIHHLENALLFWEGQPDEKNSLLLCFQPLQKRLCFTSAEIQSFIQELSRTPALKTSTSVQWSGLRSGWAGYFAYSNNNAPLAEFYEYPVTLSLDLRSDTCVLNNPRNLSDAELTPYYATLIKLAEQPAAPNIPLHSTIAGTPWTAAWQFSDYQRAFSAVMQYLQAGDCYQVNLAMPFRCAADIRQASPLPLLESFNPSFGGYFKSAQQTLFSVSPERFICAAGDALETRPIKGTVARGRTAEEDESNKAWLANSAKNQAENLMIVDLLRNDLSRYAVPHSVKVEKLFAIETHANVHHMVSTICAQMRPEISAAQAIHAAFPGGSITGAPKKRAMEIIAELEAGSRGAYCGSLGFFDDNGSADFNILIRTIVAQENGAQCWAGGGIVLDSTCEEEWQELHTKVNKILRS